jgi:hypothetical protein
MLRHDLSQVVNIINDHNLGLPTFIWSLDVKQTTCIHCLKLRGLSPRANYTDRAATACRLC